MPEALLCTMDELQTPSMDMDLIAVTETRLKSDIQDSEILSDLGFTIHRQDRWRSYACCKEFPAQITISRPETLVCELRLVCR